MAIIEIQGGPITHRYLMRKTKDELASMYMRLLRETDQDAKDAGRYRWWKSKQVGWSPRMDGTFLYTTQHLGLRGRTFDEAIDAAMKEKEG